MLYDDASGCVMVGVRYVPDTDDECYENEETEDSDSSEDSNTSNNKDDKPTVSVPSNSLSAHSSQMKRRLSDSDDDDRAAADSSTSCRKDASDTGNVTRLDEKPSPSSVADCESVDKKRRKLDDGTTETTSDVNSHGTFHRCSHLTR